MILNECSVNLACVLKQINTIIIIFFKYTLWTNELSPPPPPTRTRIIFAIP